MKSVIKVKAFHRANFKTRSGLKSNYFLLLLVCLGLCAAQKLAYSQQTLLKADIEAGISGSFPLYLEEYNNDLYFNAHDTINGFELWKYDGTSASLIDDIYAGKKSSFPENLITFNGALYFSASDSLNGNELWKYDGTNATRVSNINLDTNSSWPENFVEYNGALYFSATRKSEGNELWKYDGTSVSLVSDIWPDSLSSSPNNFVVFNGALYFSASDSLNGNEIWKHDGVSTTRVTDIAIGTAGSFPRELTEYKGALYFRASDGNNGVELWKYNGVIATMVMDIFTGPFSSYPSYLTVHNDLLYFGAGDSTSGYELWRHDSTNTNLVSNICTGKGSSYPGGLIVFDNALFFSASDANSGLELWKYDSSSVRMISDISSGSSSSAPMNFYEYNGELYFRANDGLVGTELWSYKPCLAADTPNLTVVDSILCDTSVTTINISANDSLNGASIWVLYADSCGGTPLDSSVIGEFVVAPTQTTTYFVRGEGCLVGGACDSILVTVNSVFKDTAITVCEGTSFAFGSQVLTTSGSYTETFQAANGCDSIVDLMFQVNPVYNDTIRDSICNGSSYLLGSQTLVSSGTYSELFQSNQNCDSSVVLILTVLPTSLDSIQATICADDTFRLGSQNLTSTGVYTEVFQSALGCDSTVVLDLLVHPIFTDSLIVSICAGDSFVLGSQTLVTSGIYSEVFQSVNNCDSTVTLDLTVHPIYHDTVIGGICIGGVYTFGSQTLTSAGTYTEVFQSINGCDSTVVLNLSNNPTYVVMDSICNGDTLIFGSQALTISGTYIETFHPVGSCDSTVSLTLTVNPSYTQNASATICDDASYILGSQILTSSGLYTEVFQSSKGCDSIVHLSLTVNSTYHSTNSATICAGDTFFFGSQQLTASGVYSETFQTVNGCDSTVDLTLTRYPTHATLETAILCGTSYTFGSQILTVTGTYTEHFQSIHGCDSTVTLLLLPNPTYIANATICMGDTFVFGSQTLTNAGTYTETFYPSGGCDSVVTLTLNVNSTFSNSISESICQGSSYAFGGQTLSTSGVYTEIFQSASGCDSIVTLSLSVMPVYTSSISVEICQGATYVFGSQVVSAGGTYTEVFQAANGCDSTVTLTLSVHANYSSAISATICQGATYSFGGQVLTAPGVYTNQLQTAYGCDSTITLTLNVNSTYNHTQTASICTGTYTFGSQVLSTSGTYTEIFQSTNGCDSTVTLTLTVYPTFSHTTTAVICSGETFAFGTQVLSSSGVYTESFQTVNGCDSTVVLTLTVHPSYSQSISADICDNSSYILGGQVLTATGVYSETFQTNNGCDSIVTVNLTVHSTYNNNATVAICGGTYNFGTQTLSSSGTYTETFQSINGCDSIVTLTLSVYPVYNHTAVAEICTGSAYRFGTQTLISSGVYTEVFQSQNGCDSTVVLTLTVHPIYHHRDTVMVCGGPYEFGSQTLINSGNYREFFQTKDGCDSVVDLSLTINPLYTKFVKDEICGGPYLFGTQSLTTSGDYTEVFQTQYGCDSTVKLTLTVYPTYDIELDREICKGGIYILGDQILIEPGLYSETFSSIYGCDSVVTVNLNVKEVDASFTQEGARLFANLEGADYQWLDYDNGNVPIPGATKQTHIAEWNGNYALKVTQGYCSGISEKIEVVTVGIQETEILKANLYPNPTSGKVTIQLEEVKEKVSIVVSNLLYQQLHYQEYKNTNRLNLDFSEWSDGVYLLNIISSGKVSTLKVIKQ